MAKGDYRPWMDDIGRLSVTDRERWRAIEKQVDAILAETPPESYPIEFWGRMVSRAELIALRADFTHIDLQEMMHRGNRFYTPADRARNNVSWGNSLPGG